MSPAAVLAPSLALFVLLCLLLGRLAILRVGAIMRREVKMRDIALGQKNWSEEALKFGNCVDNQFQLPMLFHVLAALELVTGKADILFVILAWAFVASRFVHAFIHTGSNNVVTRFYAFAGGFGLLILLWIHFAIRLLAGV